MAGIGFSLKKLFQTKGMFGLCRAYGYAGLICAGPMILGVILLVGVYILGQLAGLGQHERELLNVMLTYCLLASLTVTSFFNMVNTRYISDMLYEEQMDRVMPSFYGCHAIMLIGGSILWIIFLIFCGVWIVYRVECFCFFVILLVTWMEMNYLTALKDYKALVVDFALCLVVGLILALILAFFKLVSVFSLFLCVIIAYGLLMALYFRRLLKYFVVNRGSKFTFLRWFDKFPTLAFTGAFVNLGLFAHLVIMYFGPLRVQVEGLFYGAPMYDVPALCAYFSLLITTVNFVTSVEVRFYPKYRNYYSLYNDNGSIRDIEQANSEMISVLRQELTNNALKQLLSTLLFIIVGSLVFDILPLGMNNTSIGIFRLLCVGYGVYAVSNTLMLILLYFEDYLGALLGTLAFAVVSILCTIWQILFGSITTFGLGFVAGGICFYLISWLRLEYYTKRLPYYLLSRHSLVAQEVTGPFSLLSSWLDGRQDRIERKRKGKRENKLLKRRDKKERKVKDRRAA